MSCDQCYGLVLSSCMQRLSNTDICCHGNSCEIFSINVKPFYILLQETSKLKNADPETLAKHKEETRKRLLECTVDYIEMRITEAVKFAKKIPGFVQLPLDDQVNLVKGTYKIFTNKRLRDLTITTLSICSDILAAFSRYKCSMEGY